MYVLERVLFRLSQSEYRDRFILKGGVLLYGRFGPISGTLWIEGADEIVPETQKDAAPFSTSAYSEVNKPDGRSERGVF